MIGPLPPRPSGSSPAAKFQQFAHDQLSSIAVPQQSAGSKLSRTSRGFLIEPDGDDDAPRGTARKLILADASAGSFLICRPWNLDYWVAYRQARQEQGVAPTNQQIADKIAETVDGYTLEDLEEYLAKEVIAAKPDELIQSIFDGYEFDMEVESWDPDTETLSTETVTLSYEYHSATLRTATNTADDSTELQTIIPRWLPEQSIIRAIRSNSTEGAVDDVGVRLIALAGGRAWMKTTA